jgi:hypothetical protein
MARLRFRWWSIRPNNKRERRLHRLDSRQNSLPHRRDAIAPGARCFQWRREADQQVFPSRRRSELHADWEALRRLEQRKTDGWLSKSLGDALVPGE